MWSNEELALQDLEENAEATARADVAENRPMSRCPAVPTSLSGLAWLDRYNETIEELLGEGISHDQTPGL